MLDPNIVKLSVIGYLKDGTMAPIAKLQNIQWTVEDSNIGSVIDNKFVPIANGSTTLTAKLTLPDNSIKIATVAITVGDLVLDRLEVFDKSYTVCVGTLIDVITK